MATRSNPKKQRPRKRPQKQTEPMSEDEILAEEILQLGIKDKPIGAKKLREMMIKRGFDPEGNEFSRGIIEMREE